jgi:AraC-like DNA-binding protein
MPSAVQREVEKRSYRRSPDLPGFDFMEATNSTAPWQVYNVRYSIGMPEAWAAPINHDGRQFEIGPGQVILTRPGEVHSSPGSSRPGTLRALVIADEALEQYAGEYVVRPAELDWKAGMLPCSPQLVAAYQRVFSTFLSAPTAMEVQSMMVELFAIVLRELVTGSRRSAKLAAGSRPAARMRELIHHAPEGLSLGLDALAKAVGLTRFQALRAFKRRYGIPPHAYQLTVRTGLAAPLLLRGASVTRVAHELGFTDQSHFTRHFKRIWGVTPGYYARGAEVVPFAQRGRGTSQSDGITYSM